METKGWYSVTDAKVMATYNLNVGPKSVPAGSEEFDACWPTRAIVTRSHEYGEEAFTCVKAERPSGNSKKSNSNRLLSNDKAMMLALPE